MHNCDAAFGAVGSGYTEPDPEGGEHMTENVVHEDNATPTASDEDVKRMDADTPQPEEGAAVEGQGVGVNPTDSTDTEENEDPKSGGTPVHPAPTEDSPAS
jgi:hypothetical protein